MIPFLIVAVVLVVTPGPDFAMVTKNAFAGGRRAGITTAMGVAVGLSVWTCASLLGIDALMRISALAFTVVKVAGAAYLIYLGLRSIIGAARRPQAPEVSTVPSTQSQAGSSFRQGLLCNLLNPKAAVIFTSVIPQFLAPGISREWQLAELGGVFVVLVAIWLSLYSLLAGAAGSALRRSAFRRMVEGVTGCVLVALGLRLAAETA